MMMNELGTHSRTPLGSVREELSAKPDVCAQLGKCLIVSMSGEVRDAVAHAAQEAGWDTIVCTDENSALVAVRRFKFQLAWVDLESTASPASFQEICLAVSAMRKVLLVICGHVGDVQEEIWARQLGCWLYLPGIAWEESDELAVLCEQAQLIVGNRQRQV